MEIVIVTRITSDEPELDASEFFATPELAKEYIKHMVEDWQYNADEFVSTPVHVYEKQ